MDDNDNRLAKDLDKMKIWEASVTNHVLIVDGSQSTKIVITVGLMTLPSFVFKQNFPCRIYHLRIFLF